MNPFSPNSSTGFVNLLASQSSPPIDVDSAVPAVKSAERRKWSTKEDIVLISAWLNTSKDPIASNEQKLGKFWKRIEDYFNSSPQLIGSLPRPWGQCKQRWGRVNAEVCKFVGCHETAQKEQAIGQQQALFLDRVLAKNIDTLTDHEVALKNKLISEMLDV